ncbi:hypothetical protein ACFL3R_01390 [Thermodesulfobacteriota bacterium]
MKKFFIILIVLVISASSVYADDEADKLFMGSCYDWLDASEMNKVTVSERLMSPYCRSRGYECDTKMTLIALRYIDQLCKCFPSTDVSEAGLLAVTRINYAVNRKGN